jgi:hypothetical protein
MGATNFERYAFGKTIQEAYNEAREEAEYVTGIVDGTSGDLNSKPGFMEVSIPKGISATKYQRWIETVDEAQNGYGITPKQKEKLLGSIPAQYRDRVINYAKYYTDTEARALAMKLKGKRAQEFRKGAGYTGKKGEVYLFFGWARV